MPPYLVYQGDEMLWVPPLTDGENLSGAVLEDDWSALKVHQQHGLELGLGALQLLLRDLARDGHQLPQQHLHTHLC